MKFCFVTEIAPYVAKKEVVISGGGEAHVFFLSRELARRGHDVKIVTGRWNNTPKKEVIDGVELIRYGRYAPWFEGSAAIALENFLRNTVGCIRTLEDRIKKNRPDYIITPMTFAFPRALIQAKMHNIPLIAEVHDVYEMSLYLQHYKTDYGWLVYPGALFVWLYNNLPVYADLVETVSIQNIDPLVKEYGVKKERIFVTGNGIDLNKYTYSEEKAQLIVVLGRLVSYKRVDRAIRIFKQIKKKIKNVKLIIAGDGPDKKKLEALSNDDIEFLGFISEERKISLLHDAKILLSCSEFEGFGIVPIEGLACGAYPVLSNIPAHKEVVGKYGHIFQTEEDAAERICELLDNETTRVFLAKNGREFVESIYTWSNVCDNFLKTVNKYSRETK
jgi:glycosyltransferase involved in cell wall biosynthesis